MLYFQKLFIIHIECLETVQQTSKSSLGGVRSNLYANHPLKKNSKQAQVEYWATDWWVRGVRVRVRVSESS